MIVRLPIQAVCLVLLSGPAVAQAALFAVSLAYGAGTYGVTQTAAGSFIITLSGPQSAVEVGTRCEITVTVRNPSQREIDLPSVNDRDFAKIDFATSVLNAATQNPVSTLDTTEKGPGGRPLPRRFSLVGRHLMPGESFSETFDLARLFDLSKPGTYLVQMSRPIPAELGGGVAVSNQISIIVKR